MSGCPHRDRWGFLRLTGGAAALALALAATQGCAKEEMESSSVRSTTTEGIPMCPCPGSSAEVAAPVDEVLLAFLSKARAAHHEADLAESLPDRPRAIAALERLVLGPVPGGAEPRPEAAEVLADTRARLADLRSAEGAFDEALRDIDVGLTLAREPTHFRGHLFEVRGLVEERRSRAADEQGRTQEAEQAKRAAMDAFEQAIDIQDEVIRRALDEPGDP